MYKSRGEKNRRDERERERERQDEGEEASKYWRRLRRSTVYKEKKKKCGKE